MKPLHISALSLAATLLAVVLMLAAGDAEALPAFARQTGQECQACHVGSFGPQLTSYGRSFKLNGYTWGDNGSLLTNFSGMVYGGLEHTNQKLTQSGSAGSPISRFGTNDNVSIDQASIFYAGKLAENVGIMAQATYQDPNRAFAWDNTDIRYADTGSILGTDVVFGASLNNNPTMQDVWNSSFAWRFPYLGSAVAGNVASPATAPYMEGLAQRVAGAGGYILWNDLIYAELSGYRTLPNDTQIRLGEMQPGQNDKLKGTAPYWRLAVQHDYGTQYVSLGTYGMDAHRYPNGTRDAGQDKFLDMAIDGTYQATINGGDHIFSLYGSALREQQTWQAGVVSGAASNLHNTLTSLRANGSYYYHNLAGMTVGRFVSYGSQDDLLYASQQNHRPNDAGWTMQVDLTPTGTEETFGFPYLNARFFIQYTIYDKFDGSASGTGQTGRSAHNNDTLYLGTWFAF